MSLDLKNANHDPDWMPQHPMRRLFDKILIAFHHACDRADVEVAARLLNVLELMIKRPPRIPSGGEDRRAKESLVAAHERLWLIRNSRVADGQP